MLQEHFFFTAWPDHDAPDDTAPALSMLDAVNAHVAACGNKTTKVAVHCSAGVGRTGTYIALDHCLHQLHKGGYTDPLAVVQTIRNDRAALVQHQVQFVYLHRCVIDYAKARCAVIQVESIAIAANSSASKAPGPVPGHGRGAEEKGAAAVVAGTGAAAAGAHKFGLLDTDVGPMRNRSVSYVEAIHGPQAGTNAAAPAAARKSSSKSDVEIKCCCSVM